MRMKPTVHRRLVHGADFEQAVAVTGPIDGVEQGILASVVVPILHRPIFKIMSDIPSERRDNRLVIEACAMTSEMKEARSDNPRAIDHHTEDVTLSFGKAAIDGVRGRARPRIDSDQPDIATEPLDYFPIEGGVRPVVDHDHFVVIRLDVPLVSG